MARLPIPNSDNNTWGEILNDFLTQSHNVDGTLKSSAVNASGAASDSTVVHNTGSEAIAGTKNFSASPVVPTPTLGNHAANKTYVDSTIAAGAPDATTTGKGLVQLAGDLGGTAASPTVPGLASKAPTTRQVISGTGLTGGGDLSADRTLAVSYGTTAGTAAQGNDSRITGAAAALAATTVKTTNYTANVNELVPVDTTSGNITITLPTAPPDKTRVCVKMVVQGSTNTVTIASAGSDVFNKASGSTSGTLSLLNQAIMVQYATSGAIWYVTGDDLPLSQLDARYVTPTSTNTLTNKTISGASNTLSSIPQAAVTNLTADLAAKAASTDVQVFTSSGTWTMPAGAKSVYVEVVSGGCGGGSGASNATAAGGGGGGAGGSLARLGFPASIITSPVTVTVGAGGAGGASATLANGNIGSTGNDSTFGAYLAAHCRDGNGNQVLTRGNPGTTSGGGAVSGGTYGQFNGATGGAGGSTAGSAGGNAGTAGAGSGATGGAGGGGISTTTTGIGGISFKPGVRDTTGTNVAGGATSTAGTASYSSPYVMAIAGGGGTGGGAGTLAGGSGGAGGNGGNYGAGGGGGGASLGGASGAGGNGGPGIIVVTTYF